MLNNYTFSSAPLYYQRQDVHLRLRNSGSRKYHPNPHLTVVDACLFSTRRQVLKMQVIVAISVQFILVRSSLLKEIRGIRGKNILTPSYNHHVKCCHSSWDYVVIVPSPDWRGIRPPTHKGNRFFRFVTESPSSLNTPRTLSTTSSMLKKRTPQYHCSVIWGTSKISPTDFMTWTIYRNSCSGAPTAGQVQFVYGTRTMRVTAAVVL